MAEEADGSARLLELTPFRDLFRRRAVRLGTGPGWLDAHFALLLMPFLIAHLGSDGIYPADVVTTALKVWLLFAGGYALVWTFVVVLVTTSDHLDELEKLLAARRSGGSAARP